MCARCDRCTRGVKRVQWETPPQTKRNNYRIYSAHVISFCAQADWACWSQLKFPHETSIELKLTKFPTWSLSCQSAPNWLKMDPWIDMYLQTCVCFQLAGLFNDVQVDSVVAKTCEVARTSAPMKIQIHGSRKLCRVRVMCKVLPKMYHHCKPSKPIWTPIYFGCSCSPSRWR